MICLVHLILIIIFFSQYFQIIGDDEQTVICQL